MDLAIFVPLLVIMGAFMFFASRKQKKAMQATIDLHESLAVGDEIMTTAGLFGSITDVTPTKVDVEVAPGVVITMLKLAIKEKVQVDDLDDDLDDETDEESATNSTASPASAELQRSSGVELDQLASGVEVTPDAGRVSKD